MKYFIFKVEVVFGNKMFQKYENIPNKVGFGMINGETLIKYMVTAPIKF